MKVTSPITASPASTVIVPCASTVEPSSLTEWTEMIAAPGFTTSTAGDVRMAARPLRMPTAVLSLWWRFLLVQEADSALGILDSRVSFSQRAELGSRRRTSNQAKSEKFASPGFRHRVTWPS